MSRSDYRPRPPPGYVFPAGVAADQTAWDGGARAQPLTPLSPHAATRSHSASTFCVSPDRSRHVGPPRFLTIPSVRALPFNPGQPRQVLSLIASLPVADFAPSGGLVAAISITRPYGFAFAGLTPSPSGEFFPFAPCHRSQGTGLLSGVGYPPPKVRGFVLNKQLSRLTPFSQMGWPSFAWRTRLWRGPFFLSWGISGVETTHNN